mmetsp:Transcript_17813/g.54263  ORF Transcript_17813/g.54263 Transcript_17813/m.54263 type:complete len:231 (-) Transcript_17813:318-1010(-)
MTDGDVANNSPSEPQHCTKHAASATGAQRATKAAAPRPTSSAVVARPRSHAHVVTRLHRLLPSMVTSMAKSVKSPEQPAHASTTKLNFRSLYSAAPVFTTSVRTTWRWSAPWTASPGLSCTAAKAKNHDATCRGPFRITGVAPTSKDPRPCVPNLLKKTIRKSSSFFKGASWSLVMWSHSSLWSATDFRLVSSAFVARFWRRKPAAESSDARNETMRPFDRPRPPTTRSR